MPTPNLNSTTATVIDTANVAMAAKSQVFLFFPSGYAFACRRHAINIAQHNHVLAGKQEIADSMLLWFSTLSCPG